MTDQHSKHIQTKQPYTLPDKPSQRPYMVPEGFFDDQRNQLMQAVQKRRKTRLLWMSVARCVAVAACFAAVIVGVDMQKASATSPAPRFNDVAQAFESLSVSDRDFLLALYDTDYYNMADSLDIDY